MKPAVLEASEDIKTKFQSQALHIIQIKYLKACGSGNPPSLIPALQEIAIYVIKTDFYVLFCTRLYQVPNLLCLTFSCVKQASISRHLLINTFVEVYVVVQGG